jgi:hypothetical protein
MRSQPFAPPTEASIWRDPKFVLVLAVAVGLWVPFARADWLVTNEGASYVWRTIEWATELRVGELYPRWCPDFYGGYGSPLFIFYAPVIYCLAGVLNALSMDPFSALKAIILLFSLITGIGTYALVFVETRSRDAALLGAVAYLAAPYRIANLYQRGDLGEFACIALLPAVLALYRVAATEARPTRARWLAAAAAVMNALMIMTHAILGLWGTVLAGLVVAGTGIGLMRSGLWRRALLLVGAMVCAQGLSAVYIIPAIAYRTATHTAGMVIGYYHAPDNWIPLKVLFDPGQGENHLKNGSLFVASVVAVLLGLFINFRIGRRALGWTFLTFLLMLSTHQRASWFWEPGRIPLTNFVQFPWRMVGPATLTASVMLGIGMAAIFARATESTRTVVAYAGAAALLMVIAWPSVSPELRTTEGIASNSEALRQEIQSATDANEYLPLAVAAPPSVPRRALIARTDGVLVQGVQSNGSHHQLVLRAERAGAVVNLALYGFPGWNVETVSGPAKAALDADAGGLLRIHLPAVGEYRLEVRFGSTRAFHAGTFLSVLSALLVCLFLLRGSRLRSWPLPTRVAHA